uniref:Uncharacterized protein n=1 Tax=Romanomermis culicivorax TaxID=13658 RepID=A0A915HZR4_ROMCU
MDEWKWNTPEGLPGPLIIATIGAARFSMASLGCHSYCISLPDATTWNVVSRTSSDELSRRTKG